MSTPPLLPPEDRIWRHPSEVGRSLAAEEEQVAAARRRWLASTPSKAGAGTAGLVGALLATGVVLVGIHLTSWLAPAGPAGRTAVTAAQSFAPTTSTTMALHAVAIAAEMTTVGEAMVRIRVSRGDGSTNEYGGAFISPSGYVLAPAAAVVGATGLSVVSSGGEEDPAVVAGSDPATGLAVLKVRTSGVAWLEIAASPASAGSLALTARWHDGAPQLSVAPLGNGTASASLGNGPALLEVGPTSLDLSQAPLGTLVLNGETQIIGMLTGRRGHEAIIAPGWLVSKVTGYLITDGRVLHGWLGIEGSAERIPARYAVDTQLRSGAAERLVSEDPTSMTGVRIVSVAPGSAAAKAGLAPGEVIEALDGRRVHDMADLQAMLYLMPPFTPVTMDVLGTSGTSVVNARLQPAA